jgi:hypothetical protein
MEVPHDLGKEEAGARLTGFLEKKRNEYGEHMGGLEADWTGEELTFAFSAAGMKVNGNMLVEDDCVRINAKLPIVAMMFKGKIEQTIRDELETVFSSNDEDA